MLKKYIEKYLNSVAKNEYTAKSTTEYTTKPLFYIVVKTGICAK